MFTFDDYRQALLNAGPKMKEITLDRAAQDAGISFQELSELVRLAYPDQA